MTGSGPNNASLTVSLVAPIIAFILAGIVGYALKRINLARTLYVDVSYRLRFETSAIYRLMPQLEKLRDWAGNETHETPPFIIIVKEDHFVLSNIQDDLKSCLWGNEVDAVRIFYRDFQRIEHRAGKIEELYTDLVKKYVECPSSTFRTRYARCYVDQIDDQFEIIKEIVAFWLNILCYPACDPKFEFSESLYYKIVKEIGLLNKNSRFTKAATYLIYSCRIWYPTFIVLPFIAITLVFGVVFFGVFDTWPAAHKLIAMHCCETLVVTFVMLAIFFALACCLTKCGNCKIEESVLRRFADRKQKELVKYASPLTAYKRGEVV